MGIYFEKRNEPILSPLEKRQTLNTLNRKYTIGLPCEIDENETRVGLIPEAVAIFIKNGYRVLVENKAGEKSKFSNLQYSEAGAEICSNAKEIFELSDIVFKVQPPTISEIACMKNETILFSIVHACIQDIEFYKSLIKKKITAFCYEHIKDDCGNYSFLKSMSEIAGRTTALIAAEYLCNPKYGKGSLLGSIAGINASKVVIIGAGTVALHAAHSFLSCGCEVKIFDNSIHRLDRIQKLLHYPVSTSVLHPKILAKSIKESDVVVSALYSKTGTSSCIVSEDVITQMEEGSIVIDISIDQGGCIETSIPTTHKNPIFVKHGIIHYCVPNITARVPHTASYALSNLLIPILEEFCTSNNLDNLLRLQYGLRNGVYLYQGILTNPIIANRFQMSHRDINLLFDTRLS